jgi:hypothetical protein
MKIKIAITMIMAVMLAATAAYAISSKELIGKADDLNGQKVRYSGEAVTAVLQRPDGAWVNVNDGDNAIGIWCTKEMSYRITYLGDYKSKGDILDVEGTFNRACPAHGGELDIHADGLKIARQGYIKKESFDIRRLNMASGIFLATMLLMIVFRKRL